MSTSTLPVSRIINVDVIMSPKAAQSQSLSDLLVMGSSGIINPSEGIRTYGGLDAVAADFGVNAPEYGGAALWFGQSPQPTQLLIGGWIENASPAILSGAVLSSAQQALGVWQAFTAGKFHITVDGTGQDITCGTMAAVTNLNGVAAIIQTALAAAFTGSTCTWDAVNNNFTIKTGETGSSASVSFLSAPATGQDMSGALAMLQSSSGAYVVPGYDSETPVEAIVRMDDAFGQQWYATNFCSADVTDDEHVAVAAYIEASNNKHIYGISTQEAGVLTSVVTTDIASLVKAANYQRTTVQFSSSSPYSVCSMLGRILTTDYNGNNTVITLMFKQEPGIVAENLTSTQANVLQSKNCNVLAAYNNDTVIIQYGTMANGGFVDEIMGADWLAVTTMTNVYNLLYTSKTKIPQTNAGMKLIATAIEQVCSQGVVNGYLAPGVWNSGGFGTLNQGDYLERGFYVYAPSVDTQLQADREARKSVSFQVAAKLAGAVHSVDIQLNITR